MGTTRRRAGGPARGVSSAGSGMEACPRWEPSAPSAPSPPRDSEEKQPPFQRHLGGSDGTSAAHASQAPFLFQRIRREL